MPESEFEMPKERITVANPVGSNTDNLYYESEVHIGWARKEAGGGVQLGVEYPSTTVVNALYGHQGNVTRVGSALAQALETQGWIAPKPGPYDLTGDNYDSYWIGTKIINLLDDDAFKGLWTSLSREDCNRLIKVIRRARDQAYGHDE